MGGSANAIDIGMYYLLMFAGLWYLHAQFIGGAIGFVSAFYLHRRFAFRKSEKAGKHFLRFCMLGVFNYIAIATVLYVLVDVMGISEALAKIPANGVVVLWNFFIYKFLVYV